MFLLIESNDFVLRAIVCLFTALELFLGIGAEFESSCEIDHTRDRLRQSSGHEQYNIFTREAASVRVVHSFPRKVAQLPARIWVCGVAARG